MKEIQSNKDAWGKISEDHYNTFKERLETGNYTLNDYILEELGNITDKEVLHLQCNTGADTIAISKLGARSVVGVDLVPQNVFFARKLAEDLKVSNVDFIESDIMELSKVYNKKHDIVFTSEGVLGWLPDLNVWAKTIRELLNDDGYFYVFDSHPFFLAFDESKLSEEKYHIKYPYFGKFPDVDDSIGGYASEVKHGVESYFWMHTLSDIINSLINAGFHIEYLNEFSENFYDSGKMEPSEKNGLWKYNYNKNKYPMSYSIKASVYKK